MKEEIWVPTIVWLHGKKNDFTGYYETSNLGRVRSLDREVKHNYGGTAVKKGKVLTPHTTYPLKNGKPRQQIGLSKNGRVIYPVLSRCIWESFNGPIPEDMQVNHIDEDPTNNRLENLNLMTPKENTNWGTGIARRAKTQSVTKKGKQLYEDNPKARFIMEYDKEGNEFFLWFTVKAAAEYHKKDYTTIMLNLEGKTKALRNGIYFKYKEREAI